MDCIASILLILVLMGAAQDKSWVIAQGENNGFTMLLRARTIVPPGINSLEYTHLFTVTWTYKDMSGEGIPTGKENLQMGELEDAADSLIEGKCGYLTHILTYNGTRKWNWYAKDKNKFLNAIDSYLKRKPNLPIKIVEQEDPNWDEWKTFLSHLRVRK